MDIDLLSKMVKELILDNDRVVLPGLGCFVAETVPAYFSDKGYTINPPYRKLYFRARPDEGDALARFYARSNDVSYEVAEKIVKDFVVELKSVLHVKKAVVFPGLGRLRATKENNVFFIADEDLDIYPEGFGLEPISLKTHQETAEEVSAAVSGLKSIMTSEPAAEPVVEPAVEPISEPDTEPAVEPAVEPTEEPEPEVAAEPEFEFLVEPMPEVEPEPMPAPVAPAPTPQEDAKPKGNKAGKILLIILAVIVLLTAAYMLVGRLCPEWIDQFLYTPEELEIIRH